MALSQILMPDGTPAFLRDNHAIELFPIYGETPVQTGTPIVRRMWVSVPRIVDVALEINTSIKNAIDDWFENTLLVGERAFSAQVQNQGPGLLWWNCKFLAPPKTEFLGGDWWRLTGRLLLDGTGSVTGPVPTGLTGSVNIQLMASAVLLATQPLSGAVTINLLPVSAVSALSGSVGISLNATAYTPPAPVGSASGTSTVSGTPVTSAFEREGVTTDIMLREDGGQILRE